MTSEKLLWGRCKRCLSKSLAQSTTSFLAEEKEVICNTSTVIVKNEAQQNKYLDFLEMEMKQEISQRLPVDTGMAPECAGCQKVIRERYLLKALDQFWHEDCLKCTCCDCRLGEVGSTLFTKANLILCKRDYLRLFGTTGVCSACSKTIPAFEMVMRARGNVYHLECFACQQCRHRFCVGDRFYLYNNRVLCEYDYEERVLFANLPYTGDSLTQLKKQTENLTSGNKDDASSGYGSPDSLVSEGK